MAGDEALRGSRWAWAPASPFTSDFLALAALCVEQQRSVARGDDLSRRGAG